MRVATPRHSGRSMMIVFLWRFSAAELIRHARRPQPLRLRRRLSISMRWLIYDSFMLRMFHDAYRLPTGDALRAELTRAASRPGRQNAERRRSLLSSSTGCRYAGCFLPAMPGRAERPFPPHGLFMS